ncbi:hypothetical protein ES319_A01G003200v1 [Gossypium barbadense]|uniref:B box-type domain-containing protein n=1 Tax=Gossypium barbadense TaxID=3634 RepID=A0A5J5WRG7_GOSBA|nr:hypothetical protein ES319_A01G003200v1 [Gossypium barbadense]
MEQKRKMKIWCEVCDKEEATVFCPADEAALCGVCDHNVHHANKLATKHCRFALLQPDESPLCDICQEKRALLFCQEDRAILCRECDIPIHKANEHTTKHNRFLLTGVKLSSSSCSSASGFPPALNTVSSSSNGGYGGQTICSEAETTSQSNNEIEKPLTTYRIEHNYTIGDDDVLVSMSISEYLMKTLPGWRVDDFLEPSSYAAR